MDGINFHWRGGSFRFQAQSLIGKKKKKESPAAESQHLLGERTNKV